VSLKKYKSHGTAVKVALNIQGGRLLILLTGFRPRIRPLVRIAVKAALPDRCSRHSVLVGGHSAPPVLAACSSPSPEQNHRVQITIQSTENHLHTVKKG
jgi:hypothetical protein